VAVATLALGIGANTMVFALIDGVYLKPLPFPEPQKLVYLQESDGQMNLATSYPAFEYFRTQSTSFEGLGVYGRSSAILRDTEDPVLVSGAMVSASLLPLLGGVPVLGRGFLDDEDEPGAEAVVILSYTMWQSRFGGRPDILGLTLRMGDHPRQVVGVMPPGFRFPTETAQFWIPLSSLDRDPTYRSLTMVGRLTPESSVEAAAEEVMAVGRRLDEIDDGAKGGAFTYLHPLKDRVVGSRYRATFAALAVAVGLLLVIAGANLANLLLARASTRTTELAVREALGASRSRMFLTHVAEPLALSLASGAVGVLAAAWGLKLILALSPVAIPRSAEIGLDPRVILLALALSLAAGFVLGLTSMVRTRGDMVSLRVHSGTGASRGRGLMGGFTVVQVGLTFALLAGVILMARTVLNLQAVDVGFNPSNALVVNLRLSTAQYPDAAARLALHDEVVERVRRLPGVAAVGYTSSLPLTGAWSDRQIRVEGSPLPPEDLPVFEFDPVTPEFFGAMGMPLRHGRLLDETDREGTPLVAIVNETGARLHFPGGEALGKRINVGSEEEPTWLTVVGIVGDVRSHGLTDAARPKFYFPFAQYPGPWPYDLNLVARTRGVEELVAAERLRDVIKEVATGSPLVQISPLQTLLDEEVAGPRFNAVLLGVFTFAALALAALGVYGVVAFGVAERRREIGLRLALGATRQTVRLETLWQGLRPTLWGIVVGVPLALGIGRVMASMLFGVTTHDPLVLVLVTGVIAGASILACLVPSIRASRIDPMVSLREG
jgi:putative ABC transport system permease protein